MNLLIRKLPLVIAFVWVSTSFHLSQIQAQCMITASGIAPCNTNSLGLIRIQVTDGVSPFGWQWGSAPNIVDSIGIEVNKFDIPNLTPGTYTVTVTCNGGQSSTTATVVVPVELGTPILTASGTTCGLSNGAITWQNDPTGGNPPYSYLWDSGETTQTLSGLEQGTYTVTLTDANECSKTASATIAGSSPVTVTLSSQTNVNCFGQSTGAIDIDVSGGSAYQYMWSDNPPGGDPQDRQALPAGTYSVTVTSGVCTASLAGLDAIIISQPVATLMVTVNTTSASCGGGSGGGSAEAVATGGTVPYTYHWSNNAMTQEITNLTGGTYTITVTDNNNCTKVSSGTVSSGTALTATSSKTDPKCNNSSDGKITVTITNGGLPPYTLVWSGASSGSTTTALPYTIEGLQAGSYTVTITGNNGCTATVTQNLVAPPALIIMKLPEGVNGSKLTVCQGASNGVIKVQGSGGSGPYNFSWAGGNPPGPEVNPYSIQSLGAGTYTITITDANLCTNSVTATISTAPQMVLSTTTVEPKCNSMQVSFGDQPSGAIDLTVTVDGAPPSLTPGYLWSNTATTQDISALNGGTYTVTVTDNYTCTKTTSTTLNNPPKITGVLSGSGGYCEGSGQGAQISVAISNGTSPYTLTINPNNLQVPQYISGTDIPVSPASTTTYNLIEIKDYNNCRSTDVSGSAVVAVTGTLDVSVSVTANPSMGMVCANTPVTFTATPVNGGSNPLFQWYRIRPNTPPVQLTAQQTSPTLVTSDFVNGDTIRCVLTSNIPCPGGGNPIASAFVKVTVYELPEVQDFSATSYQYCTGETIELNVSAKNTGLSPYRFEFYAPNQSTPFITLPATGGVMPGINVTATRSNATQIMSGNYSALVIDAHGCKSEIKALSQPVVVKIRPNKPLGIDKEVCLEQLPNTSYPNLTVSSPQSGVTFKWDITENGPYQFYSGASLSSTTYGQHINGNTPGVYSFYAKSFKEGCLSNAAEEVTLRIKALPDPLSLMTDTLRICQTAPAVPIQIGSNSNWYNSSDILVASNTNSYTPNQDDTYTVRVYNAQTGCESGQPATRVFERWQNPSSNYQLLDQGEEGILATYDEKFEDISTSGNNSGNLIQWSWDFGTPSAVPPTFSTGAPQLADTVTVRYLVAGAYNLCLTVTDVNGCSDTHCQSVNVDNPNECRVQFSSNSAHCAGEPFLINFNAKPSLNANINTWKWKVPGGVTVMGGAVSGFGNTVLSPSFSTNTAGTYPFTLVIQDNNLISPCSDSATVNIVIKEIPTVSMMTVDSICKNDVLPVTFGFTGNPPFDFEYIVNGNAQSVNNFSGTGNNYTFDRIANLDSLVIEVLNITAEGGAGCVNPDPGVKKVVHTRPLPSVSILMDTCFFNTGQYSYSFTPDGGQPPYWINGASFNTGVVLQSGLVPNGTPDSVLLSDNAGCKQTIITTKNCDCNDEITKDNISDFRLDGDAEFRNVCKGDSIFVLVKAPGISLTNSGYKMYAYLYKDDVQNFISRKKIENNSTEISMPYPTGAVLFDEPYYLKIILARDLDALTPDFEGCTVGSETVVTRYFRRPPSGSLQTTSVCGGGNAVIQFNFSGNPGYTFNYDVTGSNYNFQGKENYNSQTFISEPFPVIDTSMAVTWPVVLHLEDKFGCLDSITGGLAIKPRPEVNVMADPVFCAGETVNVTVEGNANWNYQWSEPEFGTSQSVSFMASGEGQQNYTVTVTDFTQFPVCASTDKLNIEVLTSPVVMLTPGDITYCRNVNNPTYVFENTGDDDADLYEWAVYRKSPEELIVDAPMFNARTASGQLDKNKVFVVWDSTLFKADDYEVRLLLSSQAQSADKLCSGKAVAQVRISAAPALPAPDITSITYSTFPSGYMLAVDNDVCYQWGYTPGVKSPNDPTADETNSSDQFQLFPVTYNPGNYYWVDTWNKVGGQCPTGDNCKTRSYYSGNAPIFTTGTDDVASKSPVMLVLPNPNSGSFNLLLKYVPTGETRLRVYTSSGQLAGEINCEVNSDEQMMQIYQDQLPAGQYIIQIITSDGRIISNRMVVQK